MNSFDYDLIVIGGGAAGMTSAKLARGLKKKVAIIEKEQLGGECTWTGCIPSKTLIKSSEAVFQAQHLDKYGLVADPFNIDTSKVMNHVRSIISTIYQTHTPEKFVEQGIDVFFGDPVLIDNNHISFDRKTISAQAIILATGTSPLIPPIEGLNDIPYLTNQTLFSLPHLPKDLLILGGGPIGVEVASALNRLGVLVTIVEMQDRLLPRDDKELVDLLMPKLKEEGIRVLTGMRATKALKMKDGVQLICIASDGSEQQVDGKQLLVAVGRKPNIKGLYLERAKVAVEKERLVVDEYLRTTAKNIYACGDVVGPYLFSHMAFYQATIAVRNALIPFFKKKVDYRNVAWVTFTDPELATAGLTEQEARESYDEIKIYRYPYAKLDRAHTEGKTEGLGKFICDKKGKLIGAHIFGARAGDLISEIQVGKTYGLDLADLYPVIHPYPTFSELIWHSAKNRYIDKLKANSILKLLQSLIVWWKK
ncbi:MAG: NAD(P)/FAD-dependent oxidoreductase [Candidatus Babeliales bacterium]